MSAPDGGRARGPDVPSDSGVTCVVLAAGASTRMEGSNKLLRPVGGVPMVVRVVRAAVASKAHRVVVSPVETPSSFERPLLDSPCRW